MAIWDRVEGEKEGRVARKGCSGESYRIEGV